MESHFQKPVQHSMLRRCSGWDYRAPAIYMITLTLANRRKPLLGKVVPVFPEGVDSANVSPQQVNAEFLPTPLGKAILEHWKQFSSFTPEIMPLYLQLMEEHLHGILRVVNPMDKPLGNAIGGFKTWCNKYYRILTSSQETLFSNGFQDSILFKAGQLKRMFHYLQDNPRRLAIRRLFPDCFTSLHDLEIDGGAYAAYGNSFLLDRSHFYQIQVSRSVSEEELSAKRQEMFQAIEGGAVLVSPCISPGERLLMHEAMEAEASLIALKNNGFPSLYKPAGKFFDACAAGRLLLIAPKAWGYSPGKKQLSREQCCVLNAVAARIAGGLPSAIRYHGYTPANLEELIRQAGLEG